MPCNVVHESKSFAYPFHIIMYAHVRVNCYKVDSHRVLLYYAVVWLHSSARYIIGGCIYQSIIL